MATRLPKPGEEVAAPDRREPEAGGIAARFRRGARLDRVQEYGLGLFLLLLVIVLSIASDSFLTEANLKNVLDQAAAPGLIASAGALVIIAGGFDLSAGAIYAVCSLVVAKLVNADGIVVALVLSLALGCGLGLLNSLLVTFGKVSPFVATLGTSITFGGLAIALSNGSLILIEDTAFAKIAQTQILGFKSSTFIYLAFALALWILLSFTVFGRQVYATGDNHQAARGAGIPVGRVLLIVYVLSGLAAAVAAIVVVSRTGSVSGTNGLSLMFTALAAMLIGGNVAGRGGIGRTLLGVFTLALIGNGFDLLGFNPYYEEVVTGAIIVLAVTTDVWASRART